jgi:hypothetical protein
MTNEMNFDVQWLDEVALHQAVVGGDPEAFAELIRRFDPVVRVHVARSTPEGSLEEAMAEFWIGLIRDPRLGAWDPELGGLLAQWIAMIAAQVCALRLRGAKWAA